MTLWIMPEFDREGRAVCQFWLQAANHNETPTDKNSPGESPLGYLRTPTLFREKGGDGTLGSPKQPKEKKINKENLTWLGGRDHNDIPRCHQRPCPA